MAAIATTLKRGAALAGAALAGVSLLGFAAYSARFGLRGLVLDLADETYLFSPGSPGLNAAIFVHMILGALAMLLAPLQLVPRVRARHAWLHRLAGRVIAGAAVVVALGGLGYIAARGTIAGPGMDAGFALYGLLMLLAAVQAVRHARAGDLVRHRAWALRLFVLVMGSLIFRLHYVLWFSLTGGLGSNEQLTGPFDQLQYVAFYLPYLVALEFWLRRRAG